MSNSIDSDEYHTNLARAISANVSGGVQGDGDDETREQLESHDTDFLKRLAATIVPEYSPALGTSGNAATLEENYGEVTTDDLGTGRIGR